MLFPVQMSKARFGRPAVSLAPNCDLSTQVQSRTNQLTRHQVSTCAAPGLLDCRLCAMTCRKTRRTSLSPALQKEAAVAFAVQVTSVLASVVQTPSPSTLVTMPIRHGSFALSF